MNKMAKKDLDWGSLGFGYMKTDYRFVSNFKDGKWDDGELQYSYLIDLPRYALFEPGDTVTTSGYSSIFPAGIPVGEILNLEDSEDGMFYRAKVKLFADFASIDNLLVVGSCNNKEQEMLEESMKKEK